MGLFINPGNDSFRQARNSEIYVDKSGLIAYTNKVLETEQKYICVSRPRRFGKSMAANMLAAYYDKSCDSESLFAQLSIAKECSYKEQLNQSSVLYLDIAWFYNTAVDEKQVVTFLQKMVIEELRTIYPECLAKEECSLSMALAKINAQTAEKFIIIIDEWDYLFREKQKETNLQEEYISFLRGLFKGAPANRFVKLAYMTGVLPIKKYGTQSALNNFDEFTMVNAEPLAEYVGFTEDEVFALCQKYQMNREETKRWYDGYVLGELHSLYSPRSVVKAMTLRQFGDYWTQTDTYEMLRRYIDMNFDGLKDSIIQMLGGGKCRINPQKFQNDMTNLKSKDDVMTLLIHLGYLAYDSRTREVYIPNQEIADEFANAIEDLGWDKL